MVPGCGRGAIQKKGNCIIQAALATSLHKKKKQKKRETVPPGK